MLFSLNGTLFFLSKFMNDWQFYNSSPELCSFKIKQSIESYLFVGKNLSQPMKVWVRSSVPVGACGRQLAESKQRHLRYFISTTTLHVPYESSVSIVTFKTASYYLYKSIPIRLNNWKPNCYQNSYWIDVDLFCPLWHLNKSCSYCINIYYSQTIIYIRCLKIANIIENNGSQFISTKYYLSVDVNDFSTHENYHNQVDSCVNKIFIIMFIRMHENAAIIMH